jgi:general secretion pathway protein G
MILQQHSAAQLDRRRSAFTLLEVLVVVAIILVLASAATVAVMQVMKENKDSTAKMNAVTIDKALQMYMLKNDMNPPNSLEDVLRYIDGNDPSKLIDPWNKPYEMGSQDNGTGTLKYYVYTTNPDTGVVIRSDTRN